MSLSCYCDDAYTEEVFYEPEDYSTLDRRRSTRCRSCRSKIRPGETVLRFDRYRSARNEIEERIYGEGHDVPMAPWFMCEECGDLYWSLRELGFCVSTYDNMRDLVREYADLNSAR